MANGYHERDGTLVVKTTLVFLNIFVITRAERLFCTVKFLEYPDICCSVMIEIYNALL